jgi:ABC-type glycerol-3-phosphate transport system permease component
VDGTIRKDKGGAGTCWEAYHDMWDALAAMLVRKMMLVVTSSLMEASRVDDATGADAIVNVVVLMSVREME